MAENHGSTQSHTFAHHFAPALQSRVATRISDHLGRAWQPTTISDKVDDSSHPAALLSDGRDSFFVKLYFGALALDQLQKEAAGLALLQRRAGVSTPAVIDLLAIDDSSHPAALIIMQAVESVEPTSRHWRTAGRALAQIHQIKGRAFGLTHNGYWGSLQQDNRPLATWPAFFWARRVEPRLQAATASGHLSPSTARQIGALPARLPTLCGAPIQPTLLHGDAHQNNFIHTASGPTFIDPALYYGHPEMDLAFVDFFAPVPADFYAGYAEVTPIAPGFADRRPLWLLPAWLTMVALDGPQHLSQVDAILEHYR